MKNIVKQYCWLIKQLWAGNRKIMVLCFVMSLFGTFLGVIVSYAQKFLIAQVESSLHLDIIIILLLIFYVSIMFLRSIYGYIDSYFAHKFVQSSVYTYNKLYIYKVYKEKQVKFYQAEFNDYIQKVDIGLKLIPYDILQINELVLYSTLILFVILPIFIYYSPALIVFLALSVLYVRFVYPKLAKKKYELTQELIRVQRKADYFGEILTSRRYAKEVRTYNLRDFFLDKYKYSFFRYINSKEELDIKQEGYKILGDCIDMLLQCLATFWLLYELLTGSLNISIFVFLYSMYNECNTILKTMAKTSFGDLYENYCHIKNYIDYVTEDLDILQIGVKREAGLPYGDFQKLQVEDVSFRYPNAKRNAVEHVSLTINRGEVVSILGYNGSGKTTLSKLLTGLLEPSAGSIYINGRNIQNSPKEEIFEYFGVAYQDFEKYCLSLEDNVQIGYVEKEDEQLIEESINKSGLDIKKNGINNKTILGKVYDREGVDLSGGEWQRIALARAYMAKHEVIILDEPTASIDPIQELSMLANLREILKDKTIILISHRIGFARLADRIMFMENGKISEVGSHKELLSMNGKYNEIFQAQKELYDF